ncbi:unnamed protein product [Umbelopsis vinacea]
MIKLGKYAIDFASNELAEVGALRDKYDHRLTMHPGQYNQLASPNEDVVRRTIADLQHHARMLDLMKLPPDSIMIIHMGGTYGDKESALQRFRENYKKLPKQIKARLVLENDELCYSVADLLPICQELSIPLVLDWGNREHRRFITCHQRNMDKKWLATEDSNFVLKPQQHYSESRKGAVTPMERRAHSDRVKTLPPCDPDTDLMIEAKDKEQAVFYLYKLYNLYPVDDKVFYEDKDNETKHTKRSKKSKSELKTKLEVEAVVEEDGDVTKKHVVKDEIVTVVEAAGVGLKELRTTKRSRKLRNSDNSEIVAEDVLLPVDGNSEEAAVPRLKRRKGTRKKFAVDQGEKTSGLRRSKRSVKKNVP